MSNKYRFAMLNKPFTESYINDGDFLNRDLNWIEFNKRVLYQSIRKEIPIGERANFLAITMNNLDEFIMVRFSRAINIKNGKSSSDDFTGLSPEKEYDGILESIKEFKSHQDKCFRKLDNDMRERNIYLCKYKDLRKDEKKHIFEIFRKNIFPLLTPINFNTTNEFPDLVSKQLNIAVVVENRDNDKSREISFIPVNTGLKKIYKTSTSKRERRYILLEDIISAFLNTIYCDKNIIEYGTIRILREYDIELDHDQDTYITQRMERNLLLRKYSTPIFMDVSHGMSDGVIKFIRKMFDLSKHHIYRDRYIMDFSALREIDFIDDELYKKFSPQYPLEMVADSSIFDAIEEDVLLHHPYESYEPVVRLLKDAAKDPKVVSIRQTLYRVSSEDSPIVNALCKAAKNGKDVFVLLEIKARFDEANNIALIEKLKSSGCRLVYGNEVLKTHCKFIVIVKKTNNKLKIYSHIATGNYNEKTSKIYTDISYFTSKINIGEDLIRIFNMLSGYSEPSKDISSVYFAPYNLKKEIISLIDNEIKHAKSGHKSTITLKMNSITDMDIINKLYEASNKGVNINIYCRGICTMKPINDRIIIISIVGRFLEHSRIYHFSNNGNPKIFISSADLMVRNLESRFELLMEVTDDECKNKLMRILGMYYIDRYNAFIMTRKGKYKKCEGDISIHDKFMKKAIEEYSLKNIPKIFSKNIKR